MSSEGSTFKRAVDIFSVISSPSRLDMLRQLNSRGAMSYSELKAGTGFRAKKESGKFAYHLRKLLKQGLIAHNKADKKYAITPLGRLVLDAAREIDERALLRAGAVRIRTGRETLEQFNVSKVVQGLMREAGLSREVAQRVAAEVERVVAEYEDLYLTTSKVRELADCALLRESREESRDRFAKLGVSVWDLENAIYVEGPSRGDSPREVLEDLGGRVLREYSLFSLLPKDLADAHLEGELNISDVGTSMIAPDYVVVPFKDLWEGGGGDRWSALRKVASLAGGTRFELALIEPKGGDGGLLGEVGGVLEAAGVRSTVNLVMGDPDEAEEVGMGLEVGPHARVTVTIASPDRARAVEVARGLAARGLAVSLSDHGDVRTFMGIRAPAGAGGGRPRIVVSGVSVNLSRLAYETQGDESYFSARVMHAVEKAEAIIAHRMKALSRSMAGAAINAAVGGVAIEDLISTSVNFVGYRESAVILGGQGMAATLVRIVRSSQGEGGAGASLLYDHRSGLRLHRLDEERMPPSEIPRIDGWSLGGYTSGLYVGPRPSIDVAGLPDDATLVVQHPEALAEEGGPLAEFIAGRLPAISIVPSFKVCRACGALNEPGAVACSACGSDRLGYLYQGLLAP